jgi:hypothetical protein
MEYITDWRLLKNKVAECMRQSGWADLCKITKNASKEANSYLYFYFITVEEKNVNKNDLKDKLMFASFRAKFLASYAVDIIVEYDFSSELYNELRRSAPLDRSLTISNILRLPYNCFAINIDKTRKWRYALIIKEEDSIIIATTEALSIIPNNTTMGEIYDACESENSITLQTAFIKMIAYITNNKDVIEFNKIVELHNGEPSKKRKKKPIKIKQVTGVVGTIFHRSMQRWKQAQETEYQNNPELRNKQRPHCRGGHHQIYWTGKGRTEARLVFVHPYDVNIVDKEDKENMEIQYKVK